MTTIFDLLTPAAVFAIVKSVFVYIAWLLPPDRDKVLRNWVESLRDSCRKSSVIGQFRHAMVRVDNFVIDHRVAIALYSVPTSVVLNLFSLFLLIKMYAGLSPIYTQYLYITYQAPFFASLVIWDVVSFYIVLRIVHNLSLKSNFLDVLLYIGLDLIAVVSLGLVQFKFGLGLNALFSAELGLFTRHGVEFPYVTSFEHLGFLFITVILISSYYRKIPVVGRIILWLAASYLALGILLDYYYSVRAFNYISSDAPRPFLVYVPQALSRALVFFNITTLLPCLLYLLMLLLFVILRTIPDFVYKFLSLNLSAIIRDKKSLFAYTGWSVAALAAGIAFLLQ